MGLKEIKKATEPLYIAPKNIQQLLDISRISNSGLFELTPELFSKVYMFEDINYEILTDSEQLDIYERFCQFLNSMDTYFSLSVFNREFDNEEFAENVLYEEKDDLLQIYRDAINEEIMARVNESQHGIDQIMLLTVTVKRSNFEEAKAYFASFEAFLKKTFMELNSEIRALNGQERLEVLQDFYQIYNEQAPKIDMESYYEYCGDWAHDVMGSYLVRDTGKYRDYLEINGNFVKSMYVSKLPKKLNDRFIKKVTELPIKMVFTIGYEPLSKDVAREFASNKLMDIDDRIGNIGRKKLDNKDFETGIPEHILRQKDAVNDIQENIEKDNGGMLVGITITVIARDLEELKANIMSIERVCNQYDCNIESHYMEQLEAISTALPIGIRRTEKMMYMLTNSAAAFMPFSVEEFEQTGGKCTYYGKNQISNKVLGGDRKNLPNGNGYILGIPGAGKTVCLKSEMSSVALNTEDRIICIDPKDENIDFIKNFGGVNIELSAYAKNYMNPFDCDLKLLNKHDTNGIIKQKVEFMLGFCDMAMRNIEVTGLMQSIIDKSVRAVYAPIIGGEKIVAPTLSDFKSELEKLGDEGTFIADSIEMYVNGSLNIFNHQTNIDVNARIINFPIKKMGESSETFMGMCMYVMLGHIKEIVNENYKKGIATCIYVDEFHNLLGYEYAENFFYKLIKEIRALGGIVTCSTQNIADTLQSYKATTMFENCEYVVMLKMSPESAKKIATLVDGMSEGHLKYITKAVPGTGVIKFGKTIVPFDLRMDKNGTFYRMVNSNFHEKHGSIA